MQGSIPRWCSGVVRLPLLRYPKPALLSLSLALGIGCKCASTGGCHRRYHPNHGVEVSLERRLWGIEDTAYQRGVARTAAWRGGVIVRQRVAVRRSAIFGA